MISRWNIVAIIFLSLQIVSAVSLPDKHETIPDASRVFLTPGINSYEDDVHSRQKRVESPMKTEKPEKLAEPEKPGKSEKLSKLNKLNKLDPLEKPGRPAKSTKNTPADAGPIGSAASEAKDMEETSVALHDDDGKSSRTSESAGKDMSEVSGSSGALEGLNLTNSRGPENKTAETTIIPTARPVSSTGAPGTPGINVTANCPGLNVTLGILKSDSKCPPINFPSHGNETIEDVSPEMRHKLKYNTSSGQENSATETSVVLKDIVTLPDSSEKPTTESAEVRVKETRQQVVERSEEMKQEERNVGLPSGIVALIIAVSFAAFAAIGYVGLALRKRFMEYRHGNRELLVNDFDASDINNFEL